eukprot:SAG31_NODE_1399_length_8500_cov_22.401857_10_plen_156_part_00
MLPHFEHGTVSISSSYRCGEVGLQLGLHRLEESRSSSLARRRRLRLTVRRCARPRWPILKLRTAVPFEAAAFGLCPSKKSVVNEVADWWVWVGIWSDEDSFRHGRASASYRREQRTAPLTHCARFYRTQTAGAAFLLQPHSATAVAFRRRCHHAT